MSDVLIPDGWEWFRIGDAISITKGVSYKSSELAKSDTALVTLKSFLRGGGYRRDGLKPYTGKYKSTQLVRPGDLIVAYTDVTQDAKVIGKPAIVQGDSKFTSLVVSCDVAVVRLALPSFDLRYIYYLLLTDDFQSHVYSHTTGTTVLHLGANGIQTYEVAVPPLHEQKAIAHILGSLDDKIDQLRKTNSVLEDMASALFKSWFVDFDPVNAKQENISTGLPPELDALFPDSFEGDIPTGWRWESLSKVGVFRNGLALQKFPGNELPVIKIAQLRQNSTLGAERCSSAIHHDYVVHDGDLVFSWSGTLLSGWWTGGTGALNQHLFKVLDGELSQTMLKHWIDVHLPWFRMVASSKAVTMGHIKRSHLDEATVCIPDGKLLSALDTILSQYRDAYVVNASHITNLTNLRDTLLPKLISGELRVPEAEQMVAEMEL